MNERGESGDQLMLFVFLFILVLIGGGIVIGSGLFYGAEVDFRATEAKLLNYHIRDCLERASVEQLRTDFFGTCGLIQESLERTALIEVTLNKEEIFSLNKGRHISCFLKGAKENRAYPQCVVQNVSTKAGTYEVLTGSTGSKRRILTQ